MQPWGDQMTTATSSGLQDFVDHVGDLFVSAA
jgi:hypothetical protein